MLYITIYYIIGLLVSSYFIYYYRFSRKTRSYAKKTDSVLALIGPWVWPFQLALHLFTRKKHIRWKNEKLYYIQNGFVGNAMCWWRPDSRGYTCDINQAGKYSEADAKRICANRPTEDIAWLCSYIDSNEQAHKMTIDRQYLDGKYSIIKKRKPYVKREQNEVSRNNY